MKTITLTCSMIEHIGQVRESEAQKEIDRLNRDNNTTNWRKSYADFLDCYDDCDQNAPTPRYEGYVWIVNTVDYKDFVLY